MRWRLLGLALLLAACAPARVPTPEPPAAPAAAPAAASQPADWEARWKALVEAAHQEGKVVVKGPPTAAVRTELPRAFRERFDIELEYLGGPSGDALVQLQHERQAGIYSTDVVLAGADSMYTGFYAQQMLAPLRDLLFHPDALDTTYWPNNQLWFADPERKRILRLNNYLQVMLYVNTAQVSPETLTSWYDLLKPEYQGRIASYDPTVSGAGVSTASYLRKALGDDYVRRLYVDQRPVFTRDHRQLADWLARGTYPIVLSLREVEFSQVQRDGFPVAPVRHPPEAPGHVSAGFGLLGVLEPAPHPAAAQVFANWIAGPEGMQVWSRAQKIVPVRTDLDASFAAEQMLDPNIHNYLDSFDWDFVVSFRQQTMDYLRGLLR